MAILKPYTFVAGTKAKASEVNADFDTLYTEVNSLDTSITQIEADVETLDTTKANINGSTSNRFSVANPVNSYDAVNKQYLFNSIGNSLPYINGLGIAIDSTDTIHVDAGSCYDSELTTLMVLSTSVSKQNTEQSVNTTYYVYLIATDGGTTDVLISTSSNNPALPTGYTKFRRIGGYKTNSDNEIEEVFNETINQYNGTASLITGISGQMVNAVMPDYAHGISKATRTNHLADVSGWLNFGVQFENGNASLRIGTSSTYSENTQVINLWIADYGTQNIIVPIPKGHYYYADYSGNSTSVTKLIFYPCKGGN